MAFAPDGRYLATYSNTDSHISFWQVSIYAAESGSVLHDPLLLGKAATHQSSLVPSFPFFDKYPAFIPADYGPAASTQGLPRIQLAI